TQHVTGVELPGVLFDQLLEQPVDLAQCLPQHGAAIRFLTPTPGRVAAISGWEEILSAPHCVLAQSALKVGDIVNPIHSSSDRKMFILADGATAQEALRNVEELTARVLVHVK